MRIKLLILLFIAFLSQEVNACSCLQPPTIIDARKYSSIVFTGKILSVDTISVERLHDSTDKYGYTIELKKFTIQVEEIYKGDASESNLVVYTSIGEHACGVEFIIGEKYIIYGVENSGEIYKTEHALTGKGIYWTSLCSRTKLYDGLEAIELLKLK